VRRLPLIPTLLLYVQVDLESGMTIEYDSMDDCRLYDERGELLLGTDRGRRSLGHQFRELPFGS
jgi:hypothetical protein